MKEVCLQGFANIIRFGETPISSKILISALLAQSKLDPSLTNNRMISKSGLDLMAETTKLKYFN